MTQLREITDWTKSIVDREAGVIPHVKVLGFESKNGRSYSPAAVRKAIGLYEGRGVNVDHRRANDKKGDRSVKEHFGALRACAVEPDGLYADLHYVKSHPEAEPICERAERFPDQLGMSHDAEGKIIKPKRGGKVAVESIDTVLCVDVVRYPATTDGLFESEGQEMAELQEVDGLPPDMVADAVVPVAPPEEVPAVTPEDAARIGFLAEIDAILQGGGSMDEMKSAIAAIVAPSANPGDGEEGGEGGDEESTPESLQEQLRDVNTRLAIQEALTESGVNRHYLTPEHTALLHQQPDKAAMIKLIESWPPYFKQIAGVPVGRRQERTSTYDQIRKQRVR